MRAMANQALVAAFDNTRNTAQLLQNSNALPIVEAATLQHMA